MPTRAKVFVTRRLPEAAMSIIRDVCEVDVWDVEEPPVPRDVLLKAVADVDGVLSLLTDRIDEELYQAAPKLRVVANMAVGYDNIDVSGATSRDIVITNTPDVLTETTADLTFALLMATARRIVEASDYLRQDRWTTWSPLLLAGQDVYGKTLGIVGMGRIGQAVARRAAGFGMSVIYHSRQEKALADSVHARLVSLDELMGSSDFVCVLTPLTVETRGMIGERELGLMKPTAILVNTARGPVVDEHALHRALQEKRIWGAGLDVYNREPTGSSNPLVGLPNVVALPHIGSASVETRTRMAILAAENLVDGVLGRDPRNRVN